MQPDFNFYKNEYHGIIIEDCGEYAYFSERASDELAPFTNMIPNTLDCNLAKNKCICRLSEILFNDFKSSKFGQKIGSESVSGYYSVNYTVNDSNEIKRQINGAIKLYLGRYFLGAKRVMV